MTTAALLPEPSKGLQRLFSVKDLYGMTEKGILREDERVELVCGVLLEMSPKYAAHERYKSYLASALPRLLSADHRIAVECGVRLDEQTYVEPDLIVFNRHVDPGEIEASDIKLLIEVADTSLAYDTGQKSKVFSTFQIEDYWVVDVRSETVIVHRIPHPDGYKTVERYSFDDLLNPLLISDLSFSIESLK